MGLLLRLVGLVLWLMSWWRAWGWGELGLLLLLAGCPWVGGVGGLVVGVVVVLGVRAEGLACWVCPGVFLVGHVGAIGRFVSMKWE